MYICIHYIIYIFIYICLYTYIYIYIYMCIYIYVCVCVCVCVYVTYVYYKIEFKFSIHEYALVFVHFLLKPIFSFHFSILICESTFCKTHVYSSIPKSNKHWDRHLFKQSTALNFIRRLKLKDFFKWPLSYYGMILFPKAPA